MSLEPASSRGFSGGTLTSPVTITPSDDSQTALTVKNNLDGDVVDFKHASNGDAVGAIYISGSGNNVAGFYLAQGAGTLVGASAALLGTGGLSMSGSGAIGDTGIILTSVAAPSVHLFEVHPGGAVGTAQHAAPADGDIASGQCFLWFDQTNGVGNTKLMVKGKSADGTVKTATILLA